jgi:hypothetical protein
MTVIKLTLEKALKPYVQDKVRMITNEYEFAAKQALEKVFDDLVDTMVTQVITTFKDKIEIKK